MDGVRERTVVTLRDFWRPVRTSANAVVSLVFPPQCWVTQEPIAEHDLGLSPATREAIVRGLMWPYCIRCGATTGAHSAHAAGIRCPRCEQRELGVRRVVRVGTFDDPLATLVKTLKFHRRWELAGVLAPFLFQALTAAIERENLPVDALVPVSLHWIRRWQRGFNQSEELAREVGRLGHWPVWNALRRVRPTLEQSHLQSAAQRRENLRGAFVCPAPRKIAGKYLWLIDDVSTTGATLHAAAMALQRVPRQYRPAGLFAAVVCVTDRTPVPSV